MESKISKKVQLKTPEGDRVSGLGTNTTRSKAKVNKNNNKGHRRKNNGWIIWVGLAGLAIIGLGLIFLLNSPASTTQGGGQSGLYPFQVGTPGRGVVAPSIQLASNQGDTFDLATRRGKTVLLFFQEGVMCQPCWDQIKDIEAQASKFKNLGIDSFVSITTDDINQIRQLVATQGISTPVLSDPNLAVSKNYNTLGYGMMGDSRNGHTFVVVGPDGVIRWRADYGGAPKYTMYLPVDNLLADLKSGLAGAAAGK